DESDPSTHCQTSENGRRHLRHVDVDGQEIGKHVRQDELYSDAECDTDRRSHQSHRCRLCDIYRQHLFTRCSQAPQHRHRVDLSFHKSADTACYTNSAEQQCNQPHDANEVGEILDGFGRVELRLRHRAHAHLLIFHALSQRFRKLVGVEAWWKL